MSRKLWWSLRLKWWNSRNWFFDGLADAKKGFGAPSLKKMLQILFSCIIIYIFRFYHFLPKRTIILLWQYIFSLQFLVFSVLSSVCSVSIPRSHISHGYLSVLHPLQYRKTCSCRLHSAPYERTSLSAFLSLQF